jgi:cobalt-zinc-cadmium efflux system outer membrane protein
MKLNRFIILYFFTKALLSQEINKPITLKDSLELARKNNPFFLAEQYNLGIAKANVTTSKLLPNPVFNNQELMRAQGSSLPQANPLLPAGRSGNPLNDSNRQDWLQITMRIPVAGQRKYSIELANKNLQLSQKNLAEFERNLLYIVANKWTDVWLSYEKLNIIKRSKQFSDELLKINEIRLRNQVITQAEFLRTQNVVEQYDANLALAEQAYKSETRNLQFLSGSQNPIRIAAEDNTVAYDIIPEESNALLKYATENRADILANKVSQEAAHINVNLQEANAYPQPEVGFIYNPQNTTPYFGTFVTIPIPINNRNQGEIQKSQVQLKQFQSIHEALEQQIRAEILNALGEYEVAKINYEKFKKIFQTSEKVLETVRYSYLKGGTTIIDYLDAQRSWFNSQILYYESIFNFRKSFIQLQYVTGKIQKL